MTGFSMVLKSNPSIGQWRNFYMEARLSFSTLAAGSHFHRRGQLHAHTGHTEPHFCAGIIQHGFQNKRFHDIRCNARHTLQSPVAINSTI
jgi:hypothetical protein